MTGESGAPRVCACGCGQTINHLRPQARYATDACRARAWKARTGYSDQRAPKPVRNANRRPARKPALRVSYRKTLDRLEQHLTTTGHPNPRDTAHTILDPLLTSHQRTHHG